MLKWLFKVLLASTIIAAVIVVGYSNLGRDNWDLEARNFDIAIESAETGELLSCSVIASDYQKIRHEPDISWSGHTNNEGRVQGWLAPGNYELQLLCTAHGGITLQLTSSMTVNFWGHARVTTSSGWINARHVNLALPQEYLQAGGVDYRCVECVPPTTPEPTPDILVTPTPILWDVTPEPTPDIEGTPTPETF